MYAVGTPTHQILPLDNVSMTNPNEFLPSSHSHSVLLYVRIEGLSPFVLSPAAPQLPSQDQSAPLSKFYSTKNHVDIIKQYISHIIPEDEDLSLRRRVYFHNGNMLDENQPERNYWIHYYANLRNQPQLASSPLDFQHSDTEEVKWEEYSSTSLELTTDDDAGSVSSSQEDINEEQSLSLDEEYNTDTNSLSTTTTSSLTSDEKWSLWWRNDGFLNDGLLSKSVPGAKSTPKPHVFLYEFRRGTQAHEYFSIHMQERIHVYEWILDERQVHWIPSQSSNPIASDAVMIPRIISLNRLFQYILLETSSARDFAVTVFLRLFPMFFSYTLFLKKIQECWSVPDYAEWNVRSQGEYNKREFADDTLTTSPRNNRKSANAFQSSQISSQSYTVQVHSLQLLHHRMKMIPRIRCKLLQILYRWILEEAPNRLSDPQEHQKASNIIETMARQITRGEGVPSMHDNTSSATSAPNPYKFIFTQIQQSLQTLSKPLWLKNSSRNKDTVLSSVLDELFSPSTGSSKPSKEKNINISSLLFHTPIEVASTLTALDYALYNRIHYHELTQQRWVKPKTKHQAPNLNASISFVSTVGNLISYSILVQSDERKRKTAMKKWLLILQELMRLNSFNMIMSVCGALENSSIYRLRSSWYLVKEKHLQTLQKAKELTSPEGNFKRLRKRYKECYEQGEATSPYLGFLLKDLILGDEGSPSFLDGKINFSKAVRLHGTMQRILQFQSASSSGLGKYENSGMLRCNEDVGYLVVNYVEKSDDELYSMSLEAEARAQ